MSIYKSTNDQPPRRSWIRAVQLACVGIVVLALTSVALQPLLNLHAGLFFATVIGNLGVGYAIMKIASLEIPTGDISGRHAGVALIGGVALALSAVGLTGMVHEYALYAFEGTRWEAALTGMSERREAAYASLLMVDQLRYIPVVLITVAIAPGISEEFFYRGVIYEYVRGYKPLTRILFVGVLFALIHFDPIGFLPLVVVGVVFTWIRYVTGGWLVPALAHFAFNAFNGVILPRLVSTDDPPRAFLGLAFLLGGLAAFAIFQFLPQRMHRD